MKKSPEEHEANLKACLQQLVERELMLRKSKCTFAAPSVLWLVSYSQSQVCQQTPLKYQQLQK